MMTADRAVTTHPPLHERVDVQRTFRSSPARTWLLLASRDGAAAWLGDAANTWWQGDHGGPEPDEIIETPVGERFEVLAIEPGERIHLRTLGPGRGDALIELLVSPERGRTVVELREQTAQPGMDELVHERLSHAMDRIAELLEET